MRRTLLRCISPDGCSQKCISLVWLNILWDLKKVDHLFEFIQSQLYYDLYLRLPGQVALHEIEEVKNLKERRIQYPMN